MSRSISNIKKRKSAIEKTMKITKAMKLVSLSKLQKYRTILQSHQTIYEKVLDIGEVDSKSEKPTLYLGFLPDLGLVSSYSRTLTNYLNSLGDINLLLIGTNGYEAINNNPKFKVVNAPLSSENIDKTFLHELAWVYSQNYNIIVVACVADNMGRPTFTLNETLRNLKKEYDVTYEPSYKIVNEAYQNKALESIVLNAYYHSKVSEYTIRRIAMEKATDNADTMLDALQLEYNRVRQERITEELSDLASN